jgi:hypothetical protein
MFRLGEWKAQCDRCGFYYRASKLAIEYTGLRVCRGPGTNDCWEPRHPQEKMRGRKDRQAPPWVRPDSTVINIFFDENGDALLDENGYPLLDSTSVVNDVSPGSGNEVSASDL